LMQQKLGKTEAAKGGIKRSSSGFAQFFAARVTNGRADLAARRVQPSRRSEV
jgi:hypothetical protein